MEDGIIFFIPSDQFRASMAMSRDTEKIVVQRIRDHFSFSLREEKECNDLNCNIDKIEG